MTPELEHLTRGLVDALTKTVGQRVDAWFEQEQRSYWVGDMKCIYIGGTLSLEESKRAFERPGVADGIKDALKKFKP